MSFVYLASPYSDPVAKVRQERHDAVAEWVANHVRVYSSPVLYSPILHYHSVASNHDLPYTAARWEHLNLTMIKACSAMWVLKLPGWDRSVGIIGNQKVKGELDFAKQLDKPVKYIEP